MFLNMPSDCFRLEVSFYLLFWAAGIFRNTDTANDHSVVYWNKEKWRIFGSKECVSGHIHGPNYHMGSTQQLLITSHCIS